MSRKLSNLRKAAMVLLAGATPLVAVASCNGFGPGVVLLGGLGGGGYYADPVVFVQDTVFIEDVYYEDDWYGDPFCDPYFYDCW